MSSWRRWRCLETVPLIAEFAARPPADSDGVVEGVDPASGAQKLPTVTLAFDFSPLAVAVVEARRAAWQWAISLAAILGGVLAGINLLDGLLHTAMGAAKKKA